MKIGDPIIAGGRRCVVHGFSPCGVDEPLVWLRDCETDELVSVPPSAVPRASARAVDPPPAAA